VDNTLTRICVFCGSSTGARAGYTSAAQALGREMAKRRIGLVFGGGGVGLMGVIADAVLAEGGHAIGVIPHAMVARELAHRALPDLRIVNSMHERKATMAALADAFIAMPGGFGTFEEFCEVVTWTQIGLHRKSCGLLNVSGYYDPFIAQIERGFAEGFVRESNRGIVVSHADPAALIDLVARRPAPPDTIWISEPDET
jgi:uncharacterized protein (TIGR00730 family)